MARYVSNRTGVKKITAHYAANIHVQHGKFVQKDEQLIACMHIMSRQTMCTLRSLHTAQINAHPVWCSAKVAACGENSMYCVVACCRNARMQAKCVKLKRKHIGLTKAHGRRTYWMAPDLCKQRVQVSLMRCRCKHMQTRKMSERQVRHISAS